MIQLQAYLLTRSWRDTPRGIELTYWLQSDHGPVKVIMEQQQSVFFIRHDVTENINTSINRKSLPLQTLDNHAVDALYFNSVREQQDCYRLLREKAIRTYESDIKYVDRYLMERFITAAMTIQGEVIQRAGYIEFRNPRIKPCEFQPRLSLCSFDIETDVRTHQIISIAAIYSHNEQQKQQVWMLANPEWQTPPDAQKVIVLANEKHLISEFIHWIQQQDPDVLIGWNVIGFDLSFIEQRCKKFNLPFDLGRNNERATILAAQSPQQLPVARVPGRVVMDGIDTMRSASWSFESFSLEFVANELLGRGKLIHGEQNKIDEILRQYQESPQQLADYNLEDSQLVLEIFQKTDLVAFAIERANLTGLQIGRSGGSVAAFDTLYLPRLHRCGFVAGDIGDYEDAQHSPGGYVMDSLPGLYKNVLVLDFKSLYPSIIRTFKIDPLGLAVADEEGIPGYLGGRFSRQQHILPDLIAHLWQARDKAKRDHNAAMSQSIKIIMNSFYGVLGTTGCRFFNPKLASSITRRGHDIIKESKRCIEQYGYKVIYGDTDSVFVWLGDEMDEIECRQTGDELAEKLNLWWQQKLTKEYQIESFLEIEFETHFLKFIMPTIRGSEKGSKKRYAGLIRKNKKLEIVFKGLETVRTDWTRLARDFQQELYRRIFHEEPYEQYVREVAEALLNGDYDEQLYYRKRIRRPLDEYKKNIPPHIQAARKLPRQQQRRSWIRYVITLNGPEPEGYIEAGLDYEHYLEKQLKPVADGILHFVGSSFDQIVQKQITMF